MAVFKRYKGKEVRRGHKDYNSGTWVAHGRVDGVRYKQPLPKDSVKSIDQARTEDERIRYLIRTGEYEAEKDKTMFVSYLDNEFTTYIKNNYDHKAKQHELVKMREFFRRDKLRTITASRCEAFKAWRLQQPAQCQKCIHSVEHLCVPRYPTKATVNRELSTLRMLFKRAFIDRKISRNPMDWVEQFKEKNKPGRALTDEERPKLFKALEGRYQMYVIVIVAMLTGWRKGQILNLKASDIAPNFEVWRPPLKGQERELYGVNELAYELLCEIAKVRDSWLFLNPSGKRLGSIDAQWRDIKEEAGITDFRFHDLRHTLASELDPYMAQAALGHKRSTTTDRYRHVRNDQLRAALNSLRTDDIPRPDTILTPSDNVM